MANMAGDFQVARSLRRGTRDSTRRSVDTLGHRLAIWNFKKPSVLCVRLDVVVSERMFSFNKPLTPASARHAALINQLATPGLGTLMLGRLALGIAQLALGIAGFLFIITWFAIIFFQYYGQISGNVEVKPVGWIGLTGGILFIASWLWSLITSIGFIRKAERSSQQLPAVPPRISS